MLNRDTPNSPPQGREDEGEKIDMSVEAPTTGEIKAALGTLKNGKAPGADQNHS